MTLKAFLTGTAAFTLLFATTIQTACASQPIRINYQAKLSGAGGTLQGNHTLYFSLWDGGSSGVGNSGTMLWSEHVGLTANNGIVNHPVGSGIPDGPPLDDSMFASNGDLFLQTAVDSTTNVILPRARLESVPFAVRSMVADNASTAGNGLPSGFLALSPSSASQPGFTFTGQILPMNWQTRAPMALGPRNSLGAAPFNGKIYAIGGIDSSVTGANEQFDPQVDGWTTKASLGTPRYILTCTELGGIIYAVGGIATVSPLANNDAYNPGGNSWLPKQPLQVARYGHCAAAFGGLLYVFGGVYSGSATTSSVEAYDPGSNSWAFKNPLPAPSAYASAAVLNGKIYVVGGSHAPGTDNFEYNPALDTYTPRAPVPVPAYGSSMQASNGRLFLCGGSEAATGAETWIYDPATDSWSNGPRLAASRYAAGSAVVDGKIYVIGGAETASSSRNEILDGAMHFVHSKD